MFNLLKIINSKLNAIFGRFLRICVKSQVKLGSETHGPELHDQITEIGCLQKGDFTFPDVIARMIRWTNRYVARHTSRYIRF